MISLVQASSVFSVGAQGPSASWHITLSSTHPGNTLILLVTGSDGNSAGNWYLSNVTDGANTWSNPTSGGRVLTQNHWLSSSVYDAENIVGGNVSVSMVNDTTPGVSAYWFAVLMEFTGITTSGANDSAGNGTGNGNSTGPMTCTGGTRTNAGDLAVLAMGTTSGNGTGLSVPSGWTNESSVFSGYPQYSFAYILPGNTTPLSPSYGTAAASGWWTLSMAAYKPSAVVQSNQGMLMRGCQ